MAKKRPFTRRLWEAVPVRKPLEEPVSTQTNGSVAKGLDAAGTGKNGLGLLSIAAVTATKSDRREKRMIKWIAPTIMALSVMGGIAVPARAADYDRNVPVRRADDMSNRRGDLARRLEDQTSKINRMFDSGRLNRTHRDRALSKLQRIRDDVKHRDRFDEDRFRADRDVMDRLDRDLDNWSRHDHR
jgi:hypothetical protein